MLELKYDTYILITIDVTYFSISMSEIFGLRRSVIGQRIRNKLGSVEAIPPQIESPKKRNKLIIYFKNIQCYNVLLCRNNVCLRLVWANV
jgi:hypothetical protein